MGPTENGAAGAPGLAVGAETAGGTETGGAAEAARAAGAPGLAGQPRLRGAPKSATPPSAPRARTPYSFVAKMPSSTFAISSMLMGLAMWPFMPASNDFFLSSSKAFAVMATMGMFAFLLFSSVRISLVAM
jgi:hypothetical protein